MRETQGGEPDGGVLRVHLTGEDLRRIQLADGPALMWELALSLHWLQGNSAGLPGQQWRRRVAPRLPRSAELLAELIPSRGYFPDFLTPYGPSGELTAAMDPVLSTPITRLRHELAQLSARRRLSPWIRELATGSGTALQRLGSVVRAYHQIAIAPFWQYIQRHLAHERDRIAGLLADAGTDALLTGLSPAIRWRYPALEADYPLDRELRPNGRGLVLVPSFFCRDRPITLVQHDRTPVLVYPLLHHPLDFTGPTGTPHSGEALADLLGHSRAAVLEAVDGGGNTSELADRAGVLPSSASQHLTVLRHAGLVTSRRQGHSMVHTLTPLGVRLLQTPAP